MRQKNAHCISTGKAFLGIELGSTRIKAVLIDENSIPLAMGSHSWENRYVNGVWTYQLDDIWTGLQSSYKSLTEDVQTKYSVEIHQLAGMGFSAMMHGYLVFDQNDSLLTPFRTWRNTMTDEAAGLLSRALSFNIPQRWSIAHLYQAVLNQEPHVENIRFMTTLAGYVHWKLTGEKVIGIGDASGMFPIDSESGDYCADKLLVFEKLVEPKGFSWKIADILPKVKCAGSPAGSLTAEGAKLLDPTGRLEPGIPLCPPEGDAGTGMVATNSVAARTGNISAGTSIFAMVVLEQDLKSIHPEIDIVTTPVGKPVAMVHCNNCTTDLNAWVHLFSEVVTLAGNTLDNEALYQLLFMKSLDGDPDCGDILSYNYYSGEPVINLEEGRPLLVRKPDSSFSLANFMRAQLYSTMSTLRVGMDILFSEEHISLDRLMGHGGLFKTKTVGQKLMSAAMHTPVTVLDTAGEGGAWGIALLAAYMKNGNGIPLEDYLSDSIFRSNCMVEMIPCTTDMQGFNDYMEKFKKGLSIEEAAIKAIR